MADSRVSDGGANSAKFAEIRANAAAELELADWACDSLRPSDMDGTSAQEFALELRLVSRNVLALLDVAEAAQALAVCVVPAVGGFPMIAPNSGPQVLRLEEALSKFKETT